MAQGRCFFPSPLQEETAQKEKQQLRDVQRQVALESKVRLPLLEPPLFFPRSLSFFSSPPQCPTFCSPDPLRALGFFYKQQHCGGSNRGASAWSPGGRTGT